MLEEIALSISTFVFILCNLVVNSMAPANPDVPNEPLDTVSEPAAVTANADSFYDEEFILAGEWNSGGRIFEFTQGGKLLYNDQVMPYTIDGATMTITSEIGGKERVYTVSYEPMSARVMKLGGVTLYKISR